MRFVSLLVAMCSSVATWWSSMPSATAMTWSSKPSSRSRIATACGSGSCQMAEDRSIPLTVGGQPTAGLEYRVLRFPAISGPGHSGLLGRRERLGQRGSVGYAQLDVGALEVVLHRPGREVHRVGDL